MENLFYNLSEEEFSKSRKILLWLFAVLFFLAGVYVLAAGTIFGQKNISPVLSAAPFGISLTVSVIALFATIKRKDLFFLVDGEKIEFRYGIFKPKKESFKWSDIKEIVMPHKQKKARLFFNDGNSYTINLNWIQKKKSSIIRKHIYHCARQRSINVVKVSNLL